MITRRKALILVIWHAKRFGHFVKRCIDDVKLNYSLLNIRSIGRTWLYCHRRRRRRHRHGKYVKLSNNRNWSPRKNANKIIRAAASEIFMLCPISREIIKSIGYREKMNAFLRLGYRFKLFASYSGFPCASDSSGRPVRAIFRVSRFIIFI